MGPFRNTVRATAAVLVSAVLLTGCGAPLGSGPARSPDAGGSRRSGVEVRFSVDMSLEIAWGRFDPSRDLVVVRGDHPALGGWSGTGAVLTKESASPRFTGWARFDAPIPDSIAYSFAVLRRGDDDNAVREEHTAARVLRITGTEPDERPAGGDGYREHVTPLVYFDHAAEWAPDARLLGADLSFVPELRSLGAEYRVAGAAGDPLDILRENGFGLVRLRLWHTPSRPWHGLSATLAYAREAVAAGHELMLDIHYSDTWADPGRQTAPAAWRGLELSALADSVYAYTSAVIGRMRDEGALPAYVQVGNEIRGGLLWDLGRVGGAWDTPGQWSALSTLLAAGVAGVRDALPPEHQVKIVIHIDDGGDGELCRWFYDHIAASGVDFDVIGLSFYPWWHGDLDELQANLHALAERYGKEILVVETAYPWTLDGRGSVANFVSSESATHRGYPATPEGQTAFLRDLLATIEGAPGGLGRGLVYWEPCFLDISGGPPNPSENLTLFDFEGNALPALGFAVPWGPSPPGD
jgi:arabinogalactan endo-1,4-beta-galactosidase